MFLWKVKNRIKLKKFFLSFSRVNVKSQKRYVSSEKERERDNEKVTRGKLNWLQFIRSIFFFFFVSNGDKTFFSLVSFFDSWYYFHISIWKMKSKREKKCIQHKPLTLISTQYKESYLIYNITFFFSFQFISFHYTVFQVYLTGYWYLPLILIETHRHQETKVFY